MVWEDYKPNFLGLGKSKKTIFEILTYISTNTTALSIFFTLGVCCYKRLKTLNSTTKIIYEEFRRQNREKQTLKRQRYLPAESIYDEPQILEEVSLRNLPPTVPYPRTIPEIIPTVSSIPAVNPRHPPKALYPTIVTPNLYPQCRYQDQSQELRLRFRCRKLTQKPSPLERYGEEENQFD